MDNILNGLEDIVNSNIKSNGDKPLIEFQEYLKINPDDKSIWEDEENYQITKQNYYLTRLINEEYKVKKGIRETISTIDTKEKIKIFIENTFISLNFLSDSNKKWFSKYLIIPFKSRDHRLETLEKINDLTENTLQNIIDFLKNHYSHYLSDSFSKDNNVEHEVNKSIKPEPGIQFEKLKSNLTVLQLGLLFRLLHEHGTIGEGSLIKDIEKFVVNNFSSKKQYNISPDALRKKKGEISDIDKRKIYDILYDIMKKLEKDINWSTKKVMKK